MSVNNLTLQSSEFASTDLFLRPTIQVTRRAATNLENLEKSENCQGKWKKSGKMCFACGVLPPLQWSQNKHSLTAWVLLSADDMSVMDCQRSKQTYLANPHHSDHVLFKWFVHCHRYVVNICKSHRIWWGLESGHPVHVSDKVIG